MGQPLFLLLPAGAVAAALWLADVAEALPTVLGAEALAATLLLRQQEVKLAAVLGLARYVSSRPGSVALTGRIRTVNSEQIPAG